jgi:nitrogen fixation protein NifX
MPAPNPVRLTICDDKNAGATASPSLDVAFATSDFEVVDQHFGSATRFAIYRVSTQRADLLNLTQFEEAKHVGNENKLPAKIAALKGCAAVFCQAVGGSAIQQLLAGGIQPIKVNPNTQVRETLAWLRAEIGQGSTPWVVKALRRSGRGDASLSRFDAMEEEGWYG